MMNGEPAVAGKEGINVDNTGENQGTRRVIKRYSNRKLYDTRDSRYVTLLQIAEMVRRGEDVQIIDNTTKEDKTEVTLALAISEELKTKPRSVPLGTLRTLIQERGEKLLTSLRDGPIGRLIPSTHPEPLEAETEADRSAAEQSGVAAAEPEAVEEKKRQEDARMSLSELVASSRHTLDQWQQAIDERVRAVLPGFMALHELRDEVRRLAQRVEELEARVKGERGEQGALPPASSEQPGDKAAE
jgi:polyhydroxyalkanoate synthesis repressor PhaR